MTEPRPRAFIAALLALSALLVGSLWVIPYLPTNDGPQAILAVHIENHYGDPGTVYSDVFEPAPQFAGRGFTVLFEPLEQALGWQRGLQVALSIIVLTVAWGFVTLVRSVDRRRWPLAFLGFPFALSWTFYMGFFPFSFASGVGLFILAYALRPTSRGQRAGLAALLLLQSFLHMFAAILTGFVLAVTLLARAPRGERLRELGRITLIGLPAAALATTAVLVASGRAVKASFAASFDIAPFHATVVTWPQTVVPGPLPRALVVSALLAVATAVAAARSVRRDTRPTDRALSIASVIFILAALTAPRNIPGWQLFSQRFIWLGSVLPVVALPFERLTARVATVCTALSFAAATVWLGLTYPFHLRLARRYSDVIAGLSSGVVRHGSVLPLNFDPHGPVGSALGEPEVPLLAPLSHIGALYATAEGGIIPYTFATNPATWPFTIREGARSVGPIPASEAYVPQMLSPRFRDDPAFRAGVDDQLAIFGMYHEGILLAGARQEDIGVWKARGFVADWEQGSVLIAHFVPCRIDVALPSEATATSPPLLDLGVDVAMVRPMIEHAAVPVTQVADGTRHLIVAEGPCGTVWARPYWESADGAAERAFCSNATPKGKLHAVATHTEGRIVCAGVGTPTQMPHDSPAP